MSHFSRTNSPNARANIQVSYSYHDPGNTFLFKHIMLQSTSLIHEPK